MRLLITSSLLILFTVPGLRAEISKIPTSTFMWNGFSSVSVADSFAVATARDGIVVLKYSRRSGLYEEVNHFFMDTEPCTQKRTGNVLIVRSTLDELYFFDLSTLPELHQLGRVLPDVSYLDFTLRGDYLYLAAGFKGLWRYRLDNYQSAQFVDSSMLGVHYVKCEAYDDVLLALDDYNGILRYDLSGDGFGTFHDYLYIPFQASAFRRSDSTLYIALDAMVLYVARLDQQNFAITDSALLIRPTDRLFVTDTMVIAINYEFKMEQTISRQSLQVTQGFPQFNPDPRFDGTVHVRDSSWYLLLPSADGNLLEYDLGKIAYNTYPQKVLSRPGPVTGLSLRNGRLATAGRQNPLDFYQIDPLGTPRYDTTYLQGLNNVVALSQYDSLYFVAYQQMQRTFIIETRGDSIIYDAGVLFDNDTVKGVYFNPKKVDTLRSVLLYGPSSFSIYTISDSGLVLRAARQDVLGTLYSLVVIDSVVAAATSKGIWLYRVYNNFSIEYRSTVVPNQVTTHLNTLNGRLVAFEGSSIAVMDISDPFFPVVDTIVHNSQTVASSVVSGHMMYTVGPEGISVYDISSGYPSLLDRGGRAGTMIAAEGEIVAISDGLSINIFRLDNIATDVPESPPVLPSAYALSQNYPNPSNPTTTITYMLPRRGHVRLSVFNLLGQEVARLVDAEESSGSHGVEWGGNDRYGRAVASGVYFYRLQTAGFTETRKMVLLK